MILKRVRFLLLLLFAVSLAFSGAACRAKRSSCEVNKPRNIDKIKKNKSGYNSKYQYKSKPVRKPYVIRNKR